MLSLSLSRLWRIFKRVKSLKDENPHVVFDSNKIQHGSVIEHEYSPNGKYCAFTISDRSKSSVEVMIIDVETAEVYGNRLQLINFEKIAWSGDSQGFFIYVNTKCCFHWGLAEKWQSIYSLVSFDSLLKWENLFWIFLTQYDLERRKKRHLYYHYLDKDKPDKLIAKIRKAEEYDLSFKVSCDYKYLILCGTRMLCIANVENLMEDIKFKMVFDIQDASYVRIKSIYYIFKLYL